MSDEHQTGNALEELRAIIAARVAGAPEEGPPVLCIRTRQAWAGKPPRQRRPRKPPVDTDSLELLKQMLEDVKSGDVCGVTMIAHRRSTDAFVVRICTPPELHPMKGAAQYIAPTEILKASLMDVAMHGPAVMEEADELEDDPS